MRSSKRNIISRLMGAALCVASICLAFSSCELIYEDLDPCEHGVSLRFVYDYNMEYANAFPKQVDCLTLYIYDEEGNYVDTKVVTGKELQDENYRMTLDLEEGNYHFVAYGGLACAESSFSVTQTPTQGSKQTDLRAKMDDDCLTVPARRKLHDMFWGELTLATADLYREGTVEMMKNTNTIRIILQQMDGVTVEVDKFEFTITDDNGLMNYDNKLLEDETLTYYPYYRTQGGTDMGTRADGEEEDSNISVAIAQITVGRLVVENNPRLTITNKETGEPVLSIPLVKYLLLTEAEGHDMTNQEYLDRQDEYNMTFFLDESMKWIQTSIIINDWVVRFNDMDM